MIAGGPTSCSIRVTKGPCFQCAPSSEVSDKISRSRWNKKIPKSHQAFCWISCCSRYTFELAYNSHQNSIRAGPSMHYYYCTKQFWHCCHLLFAFPWCKTTKGHASHLLCIGGIGPLARLRRFTEPLACAPCSAPGRCFKIITTSPHWCRPRKMRCIRIQSSRPPLLITRYLVWLWWYWGIWADNL